MSKDEYKTLIIELLDKIQSRKFMKQIYTIVLLHTNKTGE